MAGTGRRLRSEAERLRERYNCPDPSAKEQQQAQMSTETMANTVPPTGRQRSQRAASAAATRLIQLQAADTTDDVPTTESDGEAEGAEINLSQRGRARRPVSHAERPHQQPAV